MVGHPEVPCDRSGTLRRGWRWWRVVMRAALADDTARHSAVRAEQVRLEPVEVAGAHVSEKKREEVQHRGSFGRAVWNSGKDVREQLRWLLLRRSLLRSEQPAEAVGRPD